MRSYSKILCLSLTLLISFPAIAKKKKPSKAAPVVYTAFLLDKDEDDTKSSGITINFSFEIKNNLIFIFGADVIKICSHRLFDEKLSADLENDHYAELNTSKSDPTLHLVPYPKPDDAVLYFEVNDQACVANMILRPTQVASVQRLFMGEKHQASADFKKAMEEKKETRPPYLISSGEYIELERKNFAIAFLSLVTAAERERLKLKEATEEAKETKNKKKKD